MPFKIPSSSSLSTESPEALFRDLRSREVQGLLAHQADILREYTDKSLKDPDVAFELPTGSGKTLVGLLLGEWRRRKFGERVVYLCPTNQLVNQVAEQATTKYGIRVRAFTGSKHDYSSDAKSEYYGAEVVAVTSYSALFNINPFFSNPQLIILDDAHSTENYIAGQWSLRIDRYDDEHKPLFSALLSVLKDILPPMDYLKLVEGDPSDIYWVDKIPTPKLYPVIAEIVSVIDTHVKDSTLRFSWNLIRDHLDACHLYVSIPELLFRPLLPPTNTHPPFANAKQRLYMSATLGEGGELERLTGIKSITRLQVPAGWDKQGIGRRLFLFPERSLEENQSEEVVLASVKRASRALVIVPDNRSADAVKNLVRDHLSFKIFSAQEIEDSKSPFISSEKAVAVVANRYDGIDFIDNQCRLLVIGGLPRATNLQERFIITRMGAVALLNDRILTRIVQAFGRCTRSATDYAAIIIWDEELHRYLLMQEHREFLHPELQAEISFGIEQSKDARPPEFLEYLNILLEHGDEWDQADNYIVSQRDSLSQQKLPGTDDLRESVSHELDYQYAMWDGDYLGALDACREVLANLNDESLRGYRALWYYLAGSAAWLSAEKGMLPTKSDARDYYSKAQRAASAIRWLVQLSRMPRQIEETSTSDSKVITLIERLERELERLGTLHNRKYTEQERLILEKLNKPNSVQFESGQTELGKLLGFEAGNKETTGAPDPWWIVDADLCVVFEDHSEAEPSSNLHVDKARQAATHPNWVRDNLSISDDAEIISVLVTPVTKVDRDALPHLTNVCIWPIEEFREWAQTALTVIRELRRSFPGSGDLAWRATAAEEYQKHNMSPEQLVELLKAKPANEWLQP